MTRCRPVPQHTIFMAGKVCFSYVFKKNRSSPTTSLNTKELGERLTIGPAGRFCASQAPQLCLAAAYVSALGSTKTGAPCSHESSKFVFVFAMSRTTTVLFILPGHPVLLCFLLGARLHRQHGVSACKGVDFLGKQQLLPEHEDAVGRFLLASRKGHSAELHALSTWWPHRNRCTVR